MLNQSLVFISKAKVNDTDMSSIKHWPAFIWEKKRMHRWSQVLWFPVSAEMLCFRHLLWNIHVTPKHSTSRWRCAHWHHPLQVACHSEAENFTYEKWAQRGKRKVKGKRKRKTSLCFASEPCLPRAHFPWTRVCSRSQKKQSLGSYRYSNSTFCAAVISLSRDNESKWCSNRGFSVPFDTLKYIYLKKSRVLLFKNLRACSIDYKL
jgi:hypothetical protein